MFEERNILNLLLNIKRDYNIISEKKIWKNADIYKCLSSQNISFFKLN